MRIAIDITPAVLEHAGIGRYAGELTRALVALATGDEYVGFYVDREGRAPAAPLDVLPRRVLRWPSRLWLGGVLAAERCGLTLDGQVGRPDIFHATDHLLPPLRRSRTVFTLHDLVYLRHPETQTRLHRTFLELAIPRFLRRADAVIAVSESTRRDAISAFGPAAERIRVIYPGVRRGYGPPTADAVAQARARYRLPERYVLSVGTIEPRKNLGTLLAAFRAAAPAGVGLVVVGKRGWLPEQALTAADTQRHAGAVVFTGYVPDDDLPALYGGAELFAFPSLYEGFGSPVAEAMACGAPLLVSDTSSLPEVAGDAGVQLPPRDVRAWAEALTALLGERERRAELRARGLRRAEKFTYDEAARRTLEVYREVHARRP